MNFTFIDLSWIQNILNNSNVRIKVSLRILPYTFLLAIIILLAFLSVSPVLKTSLIIIAGITFAFEFVKVVRGISAMETVTNFAREISSGNLSHSDIEIDGNREMRSLSSSLNHVKNDLSTMVTNVNDSVSHVSTFCDSLLVTSDSIKVDKDRQIANTGKVASTLELMSVVIYEVTRNTHFATDSAKEASELAAKGGAVVSETISGMKRISDSVMESASTIEALGERSVQIGEIIKVINDIAGQTNLLALNAAIEAARAGEQGRGFSVVADEVRKLAERTTSATNEIGEMIKGIQHDTSAAVNSMQTATVEVQSGVDSANQAEDALQQIVSSVKNVMEMVQKISASANQQSSTGEDVSTILQEIADEFDRVVNAIEECFQGSEGLNVVSNQLKDSINSLSFSHTEDGEHAITS